LLRKILSFFTGAADQDINKSTSEVMIGLPPSQSKSQWKKVEGMFARTYDAEKILQMVRELAGEEQSAIIPIVVTDVMLTPPPEWRYIIWDGDKNGMVISIPPTDPKFWRINDPNRIAIIKHRVRTAFLSAVGEVIGLESCLNERCFLFDDVESVTCLDSMVLLGPEHNIEALKRRGFKVLPNDPVKVQPVMENPEPEAVP
jgi:predicted Zn-dependent protease